MIIQGLSSKQKIESSIELPASMLGILSIDSTSFVYVTLKSVNEENDLTLFVSKFDPNHWGDIWRCEFDFYDEPGIFHKFCAIMSDYNIPILSCETSTSEVSGYHTLSSLLDLHYYFDSFTRRSRDRIEMRTTLANDIETRLIVDFIDILYLRDDNLPRLRLRRVEEYRRIFQKIEKGEIPFPVRTRISNSHLNIDGLRAANRNLNFNLEQKSFFVIPIADSKDRMIRIHLHGEDRGLRQVKFVVRNEGDTLRHLFYTINEAGWNCEHVKLHNGHYGGLVAEEDQVGDRFVVIDVILRAVGTKHEDLSDLLVTVRSNPNLTASGIRCKEYAK